jgi:hypothetical protein
MEGENSIVAYPALLSGAAAMYHCALIKPEGPRKLSVRRFGSRGKRILDA